MNKIKCPHCGKEIEVSDVLRHEVEEQILAAERKRHEQELQEVKQQAVEEARKKAEKDLELRFKVLEEENQEEKNRNKQLQEQVLSLTKEIRKLRQETDAQRLEMERKLAEDEAKIREEARKQAEEGQRLKEKAKDQQIERLKKLLTEAQRKAEQGSQELQGEVQELDLEEVLNKCFLADKIEPVSRGQLGADIRHIVKSPRGMECGSILWESKRTKNWSDGWVSKLKEDLRRDKAHLGVIVTEVLPVEASRGIGQKGGIWICGPKFVEPLGMLLRKSLLDAARQRVISGNRQSKAEALYEFVTSHEFVQQLESIIETFLEMDGQISRERAASEKNFKQRELQIKRLVTGVAGLYGGMQGVAGSALPPIKNLELPSGEETVEGGGDLNG